MKQSSTSRTVITPLNEDHFEQILEMYHEPDSSKFIPPLRDKTDDYYRKFLLKKVETNKTEIGFWSVLTADTNELIGTINLNKFKDTNITHAGCHLSRKFWGQGYAGELIQWILNTGFNERGLEYIHGICNLDHMVSRKLLESSGFNLYEEKMVEGELLCIYRIAKPV